MNPFLKNALVGSINAANGQVRKMVQKKISGPAGKKIGKAAAKDVGLNPKDANSTDKIHATRTAVPKK